MKSLLLVLVFIGVSVAYRVDMSYYHPAILDFLQEKGETLLKGLDGHEEKNDPNPHPFMDKCEKELGECTIKAGNEACGRLTCAVAFGRCTKKGMPSDPSYTPPPDMSTCLEKSNKCFHETSDCQKKLECVVCTKFCMNRKQNPPHYCSQ